MELFIFAANYKRGVIILMDVVRTVAKAKKEVTRLKKEHPDASVFYTKDPTAGGRYHG
jgi:hypothetical protein